MPGQSNDLQQWLETLKQKAEHSKDGHSHAHEARQSSVPPVHQTRSVHAQRPTISARPVQSISPDRSHQKKSGSFLMDMLKEVMDIPAQIEVQHKAELAAEKKKKLKSEQKLKQKQAEAKKRKLAEVQKKKRIEEEKCKQNKLLNKKRKQRPVNSTLGLSGNLISDLRKNPRALREAILLIEILAPPLADRDPFERFT